MSITHALFVLLLGVAIYPAVANHNLNQRENAFAAIACLLLGFVISKQNLGADLSSGSLLYTSLNVLSFLLFSTAYLNRLPSKPNAIHNPVAPIVIGSVAIAFDALIMNMLLSILSNLILFGCLSWLITSYLNPPRHNRIKAFGFAALYCITHLAHTLSSNGPNGLQAFSEALAYLLVGVSFMYLFWQDFSRKRTQKLGAQHKQIETEAIRLSYKSRRVLKDIRHDIRQPLSTLGILASVGKAISRDADVVSRYEHIQTAQRALKNMIEETFEQLDDTLQYPRIQKPLPLKKIALHEVLYPLVEEYRMLANNKGLELRYTHTPIEVISNKEALGKILRNGLDNAIKYTEEGGVWVGVRKRGDQIIIQVVDTGLGVDNKNVADYNKGWGHGTSIVRDLSEQIQASTHCKNRSTVGRGRGSVFEIRLENAEQYALESAADKEASLLHKVVAEVMVNGKDNLTFLKENLPTCGFDETRYAPLNLYKSYISALKRGPASVYIAYATSEVELQQATQCLSTITRLLQSNPCCILLHRQENNEPSQIEFDHNMVYVPLTEKNPLDGLREFGDFFPKINHQVNPAPTHQPSSTEIPTPSMSGMIHGT